MLFGEATRFGSIADRMKRDPETWARVGNGKRTVVGGRCYLPVSEVVLLSYGGTQFREDNLKICRINGKPARILAYPERLSPSPRPPLLFVLNPRPR